MFYTRTPRAAVAAPTPADQQQPVRRQIAAGPLAQTQTLWASRPLTVRAGRLVAVRLRGEDLRVGLATAEGLRWMRPEAVLTTAQAEAWVATSKFAARE